MSSSSNPTDGPLNKRQIDILKVAPIVWDSLFGGWLYAMQSASELMETNPVGAKHVLKDLGADVQRIREFMLEGDKETNPTEDKTS